MLGMAQNFEQFSQSDSHLLTIKEAADFLRISRRSLFYLISNGRLQTVKLSPRTTRISLKELQRLTEATFVAPASPFPPFNNDKREKKKPDASAKPETGNVNKRAKCRMTPASDIAPEGVTHDSHYTLAEVMRKFGIKYGRFYEVRNRFQLPSVHAWGTTAFRKEDVEEAIAKYNEEQGKAQTEAYYTCFDIMQKYGLGKTQVRRFAETHGVRIKKAKGGRANLYLKADWEAARKKAEKTSASTKAKRS